MVANAPLLVDSIATPLSSKPQTAEAARRLEGAHASVQGLFDTLHTARELKVIVLKIPVARLAHGEVDLLRAAVVFAGAGLDAVLKQLMNDALHDVIDKHAVARGRLTAFAAELVKQEPRLATKILTAASADIQLRTAYLENLTKGSLQGDGELKNVRDALGIDPVGAFSNAALESMRDFFAARNEIVHELDLKKPTGRGDFTRKARHMKTCRDQANSALVLSGEFIRATDALL